MIVPAEPVQRYRRAIGRHAAPANLFPVEAGVCARDDSACRMLQGWQARPPFHVVNSL